MIPFEISRAMNLAHEMLEFWEQEKAAFNCRKSLLSFYRCKSITHSTVALCSSGFCIPISRNLAEIRFYTDWNIEILHATTIFVVIERDPVQDHILPSSITQDLDTSFSEESNLSRPSPTKHHPQCPSPSRPRSASSKDSSTA